MKKVMLGLVVLLSFQVCTSELNEIDGVVGDHIDSGGNTGNGGDNRLSIPAESFLGQYFANGNITSPISARIENRIRHDFNSPVRDDYNPDELSAKWSGDFYFESGDYNFTIKSDKDISVIIDDIVVLNESSGVGVTVHNINQQLDGVHRIVVEYNLNEEPVEIDNSEETVPEETVPEETVPEETIPEETIPEETIPEETIPEETIPEETIPEETIPEDQIVEENADTPTVEVDWDSNTPPTELNLETFYGKTLITKGGTYSGIFINDEKRSSAISIRTSEPVIIENSIIKSVGSCIASPSGSNCNLIVRNCYGEGLEPLENGSPHGRFMYIENPSRVIVENNHIYNTSGIYLLNNGKDLSEVKVRNNYAHNINGWHKDKSDYSFRQFLQFNKIRNLSGCEISWNHVYNEWLDSKVEDNINMYQSSGTPSNPIRIHDNLIDGSWPHTSTGGHSGGGIMCGDGAASSADLEPHDIIAYNNTIVRTSNYGVAIAVGHNIKAYDNIMICSGFTPSGIQIKYTNVGLYVWDYADSPYFANNEAYDNLVGWDNTNGGTGRNDWWLPDCKGDCGNTRISDTNITKEHEDYYMQLYLDNVDKLGKVIGLTDKRLLDLR